MLIGYARVSTDDQNPDHQYDALTRAGVAPENVHLDKISGSKTSRPKFDLVLQLLREGDTLVVTRLDRLGRSMVHLVNLGAELRERGIHLLVTEQGIDTRTPEGRAMYGMFSVFAEFQRELIVANTRDGLAAARARGRNGGRPKKLRDRQAQLAREMYDEVGEDGKRKWTVQQIADELGVKRTTVYGYLKAEDAVAATAP
ncbi:recombinase family protein [Microbispora siamensis]|uniref:Resolvase n=1 Tax=Microbispora siamensis TaxID=564413 RepID=A0ABQ4GRC5_9ACTN|nr:recombinase family protein [Microbispora siamensis]GIH63981.1 resolvase [Microbispora siamensis]